MKITKWVDMGAEVDVDIDARDISAALSEVFSVVVEPKFEEVATARDVIRAIAMVGTFLTALTDEHIAALNEAQRTTVFRFLGSGSVSKLTFLRTPDSCAYDDARGVS